MVAPVPHHLLSTYYRAADVVLVPSRSESFGLVALEAAACGTPVVAAAVGGLRTLVDHGRTGFLVEGRDPAVFASYAEQVLDVAGPGRRAVAPGGRARRQLHLVHRGRPAAPRVRRPHRPRPRRLPLSAPRPWCRRRVPTSSTRWSSASTRGSPTQLEENPVVAAVDRDETPGERRWFVRVRGEQKDTFTIWFHLQQRTLHYETYVMPAPEENHAAFFEHLLRRNRKLYGAAFAIGEEDAIFLVGQVDNAAVTDDELDRVLGSLYAWVEQFFRPALRIGFASRFSG